LHNIHTKLCENWSVGLKVGTGWGNTHIQHNDLKSQYFYNREKSRL